MCRLALSCGDVDAQTATGCVGRVTVAGGTRRRRCVVPKDRRVTGHVRHGHARADHHHRRRRRRRRTRCVSDMFTRSRQFVAVYGAELYASDTSLRRDGFVLRRRRAASVTTVS